MATVDSTLEVPDGVGGVIELDEAEAAAAEAEAQAQVARERADHLRRAAQEGDPVTEPTWRRLMSRVGTTAFGWVLALVASSVLLAGTGYMMWQHHRVAQDRQRAADYESAARQGVLALFSIHFDKADEAVQAIIDASTGQFRDDFQKGAEDFTRVAADSKVISEGAVNASAVQTMTGESAEVLVAATSRVSNGAGAANEPRRWRLAVTVTRDGGQAKMSKVEFVP